MGLGTCTAVGCLYVKTAPPLLLSVGEDGDVSSGSRKPTEGEIHGEGVLKADENEGEGSTFVRLREEDSSVVTKAVFGSSILRV